jgi:NAD(P)-dependent dehydrogenase (short-subunit alcohol dehydrogenase family)
MKKVIITGNKGLIGRSVTSYLAGCGYDCVGLDYVDGHDLTDEEYVKNFFKENPADGLVNLFALNHHIDSSIDKSSLWTISLDSFRKYMDINLTALFSVCREYARWNVNGSIVNFSSTYGVDSPRKDLYNGEEKHIGYSVSKAGVLMLSKHLATHLAPNIRVNSIIPGGVFNSQSDDFVDKYSKFTPMGRMMNNGELSGMVEFLLSEKSSYVTGAEFKVDGGWTAW